MSIFSGIAALNLVGNLMITVRTNKDGTQTVSVLLDNKECGDNARKQIVPLTMTATPAELDGGFLETIGQPMQNASGIMVNMEAHLKSVENAKKEAAVNKANAPKTATASTPAAPPPPAKTPEEIQAEKDEAERLKQVKAYEDAMTKANGFVEKKNWKAAIDSLPLVSVYPDMKDAIEGRKKEILNLAAGGAMLF